MPCPNFLRRKVLRLLFVTYGYTCICWLVCLRTIAGHTPSVESRQRNESIPIKMLAYKPQELERHCKVHRRDIVCILRPYTTLAYSDTAISVFESGQNRLPSNNRRFDFRCIREKGRFLLGQGETSILMSRRNCRIAKASYSGA